MRIFAHNWGAVGQDGVKSKFLPRRGGGGVICADGVRAGARPCQALAPSGTGRKAVCVAKRGLGAKKKAEKKSEVSVSRESGDIFTARAEARQGRWASRARASKGKCQLGQARFRVGACCQRALLIGAAHRERQARPAGRTTAAAPANSQRTPHAPVPPGAAPPVVSHTHRALRRASKLLAGAEHSCLQFVTRNTRLTHTPTETETAHRCLCCRLFRLVLPPKYLRLPAFHSYPSRFPSTPVAGHEDG